jgi:hypothetical protein
MRGARLPEFAAANIAISSKRNRANLSSKACYKFEKSIWTAILRGFVGFVYETLRARQRNGTVHAI